jgi:hypothetical protein
MVAALSGAAPDARAAAGAETTLPAIVNAYHARQFDQARVLMTAVDAGALRSAIDADRATSRAILASIALEAADVTYGRRLASRADLMTSLKAARQLLETGCDLMQAARNAPEFQRAWSLASVALASGDGGSDFEKFLDRHVAHVAAWVGEPTAALTRAIGAERALAQSMSDELAAQDRRIWLAESHRRLDAAVAAMTLAAQRGDETQEAGVRLVMLQVNRAELLGEPMAAKEAFAALERAAASSPDATVRFLAQLVHGRGLLQLSQPRAAADAFQRAHDVMPCQSALIALEAAQLLAGETTAGRYAQILSESEAPDPWRDYYSGAHRRWPEALAALRQAAQ